MEKTKQKNGTNLKAVPKINRRMQRISIDPRMFLEMMRPNTCKWATDGIPSDVEYMGMTFDAPSGTWQIFITHDSFEEVLENTVIPQAIVRFRTEPIVDVEPVQ